MPPNLMIVDDSRAIVRALEMHFSENGYNVLTASDGFSALELMRTNMPDVVILDIRMPGMDGIAAVKKIRSADPQAKIIMCSAMGQKTMVLEAMEAGAANFIVKPFDKEKVVETVRKTLG